LGNCSYIQIEMMLECST